MRWETVIGLEVHIQLDTNSKLFSRSATSFAARPNTHASIIDLGFPGVLPQLNERAIQMAIAFGLAIEADISRYTVFARKHYFYPDLPKGFQMSQMSDPIVYNGHIVVEDTQGQPKRIGIERAHLEEDAGKSIHNRFENLTAIDLNRAGTPLIEVVSRPEISSAKEAVVYLKKIHSIVRALGISDGNMAEGSMRCDANVSVRSVNSVQLGTRVEIKNINSFRFVEKAIEYEAARQIDLLENNMPLTQETRLYDQAANVTRTMRSKEEANDYRYFPEPDLLPLVISDDSIMAIQQNLPELPDAKRVRYLTEYALPQEVARQLVDDISLALYFDAMIDFVKDTVLAANWITGVVPNVLAKRNCLFTDITIEPSSMACLLNRVSEGVISNTAAKSILDALLDAPKQAIDSLIAEKGLEQISNEDVLADMVREVIANHPAQIAQYRQATDDKRKRLIGFFVGQVMKKSQGKAKPRSVQALFSELVALQEDCR